LKIFIIYLFSLEEGFNEEDKKIIKEIEINDLPVNIEGII